MKKFLIFLCALMVNLTVVYAQTRTITGSITGADGKPISGASVQIKGTKNGVAASNEGTFTISVKNGDILVISSVNFGSREVPVTSETSYSIVLEVSTNTISEVVVTAAGIRRAEKSLGYSISKVNPGELLQKSEPDVLKTLQGKVPGVDIRSSQGTPGAATRIQIRGNSSFTGNNQPLIIVDGIPYSNDQVTTSSQTSGGGAYSSGIADLDPNDIATLSVLKGSAAAALYGSRASNGVVVITTKSGSASRSSKGLSITYKSSASFEKIANLPEYQNLYGAGSQGNYSNSNGSWGPAFADLDSIPAWPDYINAYPELFPSSGNIAYKAYPNNVKDLFRTGTVYENSINVNGGDEKNAVSLTASQLNHNGYVPNSSYKKTNVSVGGSTKTKIGLNMNGHLSYSRSNQFGGIFGENQVDGAASQFARSLFLARNWDLNLPYQDKVGNPIQPNVGGQFDNPRWSYLNNTVNTIEERITAGMSVEYNFNSWIKASYNLGTNVVNLSRREITEVGSRAALKTGGTLVTDDYKQQEIEGTFLLTFTPKISDDLSLSIIAGQNYNQRLTTEEGVNGKQFVVKGIHSLYNTVSQTAFADEYVKRRILGAFGEVTVGYKSFAYITATGRNDWSSTLPVSSRSYFYPSVSGSFVFSDAFKINKSVLNYGKIRAGWAKVGRDASPYNTTDYYTYFNPFLGQPSISLPTGTTTSDLKPEFTRELEVGTELGFMNSRIQLDFTYYDKLSTDVLAPISLPASSGYSALYKNFGKISNKGLEIGLTVKPVVSRNFNWEIRGSFTRNKNIVTDIGDVERFFINGVLSNTISPYFEKDQPYGYLRGTVSLRDSKGNLLINPATGGMIQAPDQANIGNPNPDFKLGITNTVTYKEFFLEALFDMTKGGDMYSVTVSSMLGRGVTKDTKDRSSGWVIPGVYADVNTSEPLLDDKGNEIPNITRITTNDLYFSPNPTSGATFGINTPTEWNIYDATVYRLREVTLGYNFPKTMFKKLPIGSLTLSFTGRNLWFLAPNFPKYTNFDPEVNSFGSSNVQGIELSAAPTTRRYGINLNVTF